MKTDYFSTFAIKTDLRPLFYVLIVLISFNFQSVVIAEEHKHQHDEHEEADLKFSAAELKEFSIKLSQASSGELNKTLELAGEVIVAPESLYHVVPRVSGVVRKIFKHLGDKVKKGDLLAILSSRELADAKAQFVAANSLLQLANTNLKREKSLYQSKITAKRKYLAAKQVQAEMAIKRKAAQQRLLAIGLNKKAINSLLRKRNNDLAVYELRAPANGIIIKKHAALGEVLKSNLPSFTLADLTQVWANLTLYQKDLSFIHEGQQVIMKTRFNSNDKKTAVMSTISWISPILDEKTRSAIARVVIENSTGDWRPGLFVNGQVIVAKIKADIVIPQSALQKLEGKTVVFTQHEDGDFAPQVVKIGRKDAKQVEILHGLTAGQTYVSQNAFALKAQLQKGEFDSGHHH